MSTPTAWDVLPPVGPCLSLDGHSLVDVVSMDSYVPVAVLCTNCSQKGTVVVFGPAPVPYSDEELDVQW